MNKKAMAATGLFAAISVAGAVGLLMSGGSTAPRRMAKRAGAAMSEAGHRLGQLWQSTMKK